MGSEKAGKIRLAVVYRPNFQAANFVVSGLTLPEIDKIPLKFKESRICKILFGIFMFLRLHSMAAFFRYEAETLCALKNASQSILFWDCLDLREYLAVHPWLKKDLIRNIFFWNPLSRWASEKSVAKTIRKLKLAGFRLHTFDPKDSDKYALHLLKNVNRMFSESESVPIREDFYFVGKTKDRKEFLNALEKRLQSKGFRTKFLLIDRKEDSISNYDNIRFSQESACIVDVVSPGQSGLTLRPFDALFLEKKLITNCEAISKMDFYDPANIYIIRDLNLDGLEEFMSRPYKKVDRKIVCQYEINRWIRNIF